MLLRRLFYCSMEEFRLAALNTHLKAFRAAYDQYLSEVVKLVSIIEALPESDQYLSEVSLQHVRIIEELPDSEQHLSEVVKLFRIIEALPESDQYPSEATLKLVRTTSTRAR